MITLRPRYVSRHPAKTGPLCEADCRHVTLEWTVPADEVALVCVDVWDRDTPEDAHAEDDRVVRKRIVPVLKACRASGLLVVHAPAPPIARRHPNYAALPWKEDRDSSMAPPDAWPPEAFRARKGLYAALARPDEARKMAAWKALEAAEFHPLARPEGDEPVIATGEELHRLCAARRILHLVYVGFHTPGCMTGRTYGVMPMLRRGYTIILLRDCTNGMETHETSAEKLCLRGEIAHMEQVGVYTMTGDEFAAALRAATP